MNDKQRRFVAEYLIDLNATQAAIRAGYSDKTAKQIGSRLLTNVDIGQAISEGKRRQLEKADLTAARVLEEIRRCAFLDFRTFFDEQGNLKPIRDWTAEQGSAVGTFEVLIKNAKAGDGHTDTIHRIKAWDKKPFVEMAANHFGVLKEVVDVQGGLTIEWLRDE